MATRMKADERRQLVLAAARRAFAGAGFHGTTTDAVAKEAGVSQPYVVRMFGTKLDLFIEVFEEAAERIQCVFQDVLEAAPFDPDRDEDWDRLSAAYTDLVADPDVLQVLMHGFSAGSVDEIAAVGRRCMTRIYATLLSTGCTPSQARDVIAHGMLLNVLLSVRAPEALPQGGALGELTASTFGDALPATPSPAGPSH